MASQSLIQISDLLENYSITFEHEVPDRLKCVICKNVLKNAKQTSCGCKVCEKCINVHLKDCEKPCPSKQADCADTKLMLNRDIHQDNATNREIANLKAKCPFKSCVFLDSLRMMLTHIDTCEHREVKCDKCDKRYSYKEKVKHDSLECDMRIVSCQYCQETMTALKLRNAHLNEDDEDLCSKYVGDCVNGCGTKNVNLKNHLKSCTNKKIDCPFSSMKCDSGKLTTVDLTKHLQTESIPHFNAMVTEINFLKSLNKSLTDDLKRFQSLIKEQMDITKKLTDSQQKMERTIEDLKKKTPGGASSSQEKYVIFRNGSFIWKITDYESLKFDAENSGRASVTSEPFYTSEFGYKMCLRIYPAGDGVGRNTHLSVFFALMKGDYDDLLSWPFKQKVTLSLLDQENNGAKNHSDTFKPDARSACYQKPVDECNIASGSPKFIPLNNLVPSSIYYKNDTLFMKISVDTIGMSKP